ncbi:MAG: hypothetical protein JNK53_04320 [Phycisphaerae bacterium]|nr:hypothetical protein [Phycisphaerae bacterium]
MQPNDSGRAIDSDALAWTALLSHWTEYARAAMALPKDASGQRWRAAVPHVITLQALGYALDELARVPAEDRSLARDRAALAIRAAAQSLCELWGGEPLPDSLLTLVETTERSWRSSGLLALTELFWPGPEDLVMPSLPEPGGVDTPGGTLLAMAPGTVVLAGEPVAIFADRPAPQVDGAVRRPVAELTQLFRTFDAAGRWTGTVRVPVDAEAPHGVPLLVPIWVRGERMHFEHPAPEAWTATQRAAGIGRADSGRTNRPC